MFTGVMLSVSTTENTQLFRDVQRCGYGSWFHGSLAGKVIIKT